MSKWEKAIRMRVLFQEESVYRRVRAAIAAPSPGLFTQLTRRCAQKKAEKLSSRRRRDMPRPGTGDMQQSLFSPHRSVSSSPSPSLAHFASFPSFLLSFVSLSQLISLTLHYRFFFLFIYSIFFPLSPYSFPFSFASHCRVMHDSK